MGGLFLVYWITIICVGRNYVDGKEIGHSIKRNELTDTREIIPKELEIDKKLILKDGTLLGRQVWPSFWPFWSDSNSKEYSVAKPAATGTDNSMNEENGFKTNEQPITSLDTKDPKKDKNIDIKMKEDSDTETANVQENRVVGNVESNNDSLDQKQPAPNTSLYSSNKINDGNMVLKIGTNYDETQLDD